MEISKELLTLLLRVWRQPCWIRIDPLEQVRDDDDGIQGSRNDVGALLRVTRQSHDIVGNDDADFGVSGTNYVCCCQLNGFAWTGTLLACS